MSFAAIAHNKVLRPGVTETKDENDMALVQGLMPNARTKEFRRSNFWELVFAAAVVLFLLLFFVMKFIPYKLIEPKSTILFPTVTRTVFVFPEAVKNSSSYSPG